jgi:hypothetical protein
MNTEELFQKVKRSLPIKHVSDDFITDVKRAYKEFFDDISNLEVDAFGDEKLKNTAIQDVKVRIRNIVLVLERYLDGCHSEAYQLLKEQIMKSNGFLDIDVINKGKGDYFYRARNNDGCIHSFKDMFHIPNNKRGIVKTERFSAPGYPCLYLGNTVYDCWEEMGRPSFEELFFSGFRVVNDFMLYDLRKPNKVAFEKENLPKTLRRLVYIIACQFKVLHKEQPFKPEYIIPQLILELIISSNREKNKKECGPYELPWGIVYTSTHQSKDFQYQEDFLENVAIPVVDSGFNNVHCNFLASLFEISDPICYRYEELKERETGLFWEPMEIDEKEKIAVEYAKTKMGFIERRLKQNTMCNDLKYLVVDGPTTIKFPWQGGSKELKIRSNDKWSVSFGSSSDEFEGLFE